MKRQGAPPAAVACPSKDELCELSSGKLDETRLASVTEHLSHCARCQAFLDSYRDESDSVIRLIRSAGATSFEPGELSALEAELLARGPTSEPVASPHDSRPFPKLFGGYQLGKFLGQGGMGTVYAAQHVKLKRPAVVKFLSPRRLGDGHSIDRFHREMEAIGRFSDPHIILAHDAGEVEGHFYLVMEHVEGVDLRKLLAWHGPLPVAAACELARQAAEGLACAHRHGVIHRDVKPSNLLVSKEAQVKVLDLGLAFFGGRAEPLDRAGTADYMAPEQWTAEGVDERTDVYGLGGTLYKLLTGTVPTERPLRLAELRPDAPHDLCTLVDRMLAASPKDRIATMDEVAAALASFASDADLRELIRSCCVVAGETRRNSASRTQTLRSFAAGLPGRAVRGRKAAWTFILLLVGVGSLASFLPLGRGSDPINLLENQPLPWADHGLHEKAAEFGFLPEGGFFVHSKSDSAWLCAPSTPPGPVHLTLEYSEPQWLDGTGIFFGAHESPEDATWSCQAILVKPTVNAEQEAVLDIYWRELGTNVGHGGSSPYVAMERVKLPDADKGRARLEVVLGENGLEHVLWDGQELRELTRDSELSEAARQAYSPGGLGLWNGGGTTWFHRFTFDARK